MKAPLLFLCLLIPLYANAAVPQGYQRIGEAYGIPPELLYAVALTESEAPGIGKPWPWTANVAGEGHYFASRQALFDALNELQKRGADPFRCGSCADQLVLERWIVRLALGGHRPLRQSADSRLTAPRLLPGHWLF